MPTPLPENPFILNRFDDHFDEAALVEAIEQPPAFIADPSPEYLDALWTLPLIEVLTKY